MKATAVDQLSHGPDMSLPAHLDAQTLAFPPVQPTAEPEKELEEAEEEAEEPEKESEEPEEEPEEPEDELEKEAEEELEEEPDSSKDPPSSWIDLHHSRDATSISQPDSDSIDFLLEGGDSFAKPFNMSYVSVASAGLVDDLDQGRLMPLLVAAYDMLFPGELKRGIDDGTLTVLDESSDEFELAGDDDGDAAADERRDAAGLGEGDGAFDRPGAREKKGFVDGIFTWMKRVPVSDESELAVSSVGTDRGCEGDLKRKMKVKNLHLAYETSNL